jgi:hypothetical protein
MQFCSHIDQVNLSPGVERVPVYCTHSPVPGSMFCLEHQPKATSTAKSRTFETGATRDADFDKPDYEGYLSPLSIERYGQYMLKHQLQSDGTKRDSDNWQKGIPLAQYVKSLLRHVVQVWKVHRGYQIDGSSRDPQDIEEILCAVIFNAQGMLHEIIKKRLEK